MFRLDLNCCYALPTLGVSGFMHDDGFSGLIALFISGGAVIVSALAYRRSGEALRMAVPKPDAHRSGDKVRFVFGPEEAKRFGIAEIRTKDGSEISRRDEITLDEAAEALEGKGPRAHGRRLVYSPPSSDVLVSCASSARRAFIVWIRAHSAKSKLHKCIITA